MQKTKTETKAKSELEEATDMAKAGILAGMGISVIVDAFLSMLMGNKSTATDTANATLAGMGILTLFFLAERKVPQLKEGVKKMLRKH